MCKSFRIEKSVFSTIHLLTDWTNPRCDIAITLRLLRIHNYPNKT